MLFAVGNSIYMIKNGSYQKYELKADSEGKFYLEEVAGSLDKLPATYQVLTFAEVCARMGLAVTEEKTTTPKKTARKVAE